MSVREIAVPGSLASHQVEKYLKAMKVDFGRTPQGTGATFTVAATDEQWDQIQAWVKKVTG